MSTPGEPPFTYTPRILSLVAEIGEALRRQVARPGTPVPPKLRRENRLRTIKCLANGPLAALACMKKPGLSHRPTFRKNYLQPALDGHLIERTLPDKPHGVPPWTQFQAGVSPPGKLKPRRARCGRAQRRG